jgi:nicotinamide mononucleotide transporter
MLARKIYDHWYLWIVVNSTATVLFIVRGLYPTVILYIVYGVMSFAGLVDWRKSLTDPAGTQPDEEKVI